MRVLPIRSRRGRCGQSRCETGEGAANLITTRSLCRAFRIRSNRIAPCAVVRAKKDIVRPSCYRFEATVRRIKSEHFVASKRWVNRRQTGPLYRMDPRDLRQAFAANLRRLRHARRISQEDLAYTADVNRSYLSKLEKGASYPGLEVIAKLANVLEVDPAELLKIPRTMRKLGFSSEGSLALVEAMIALPFPASRGSALVITVYKISWRLAERLSC